MSLQLLWDGGGEAVVVSTDGNVVELSSTRSSPPGSPLIGSVQLQSVSKLRVKVHGCSKQPDGRFLIRGRWIDLTRPIREEVVSSVG